MKCFRKIGKSPFNFRKMHHPAKYPAQARADRLLCLGGPIGVISFKKVHKRSVFFKIGKLPFNFKKIHHPAKYPAQAMLQCLGGPIGAIGSKKSV